MIKLLTDTRL